MRVRQQFPQIFTDASTLEDRITTLINLKGKLVKDARVVELPEEALEGTLEIRQGGLPVLITVPHDGNLKTLRETELPTNTRSKGRDIAVNYIARDIFRYFTYSQSKHPSLIIERVHRTHATPQIETYFEEQVIKTLCNMLIYHNFQGPLLHIDLHGFGEQPVFGDYDLILGTGYRTTIGETQADIYFATFMQKEGYRVYLPGEEYKEGEKFSADNPQTLVQRVRSFQLPNVISMQIETWSRFRRKGSKYEGQTLSVDLADFIANWSNQIPKKF